MNTYLISIKTAIIIFPILAFVMTLPYMFFQYRRYGSINKLRTLIIYSFVLYLTVAYFLIILPLPSFEDVTNLTTPKSQLVPFSFIKDFLENTSLIITNPNTYMIALKEPYLYQVLYNFILLLPLGIYLHYYFNLNLKRSTFIVFLVSLFFELTQLTGLYFIYPRSYRLFDVDDLLINTLGGIFGYIISPLFTFFLPTREKIDERAYLDGRKVSFLRTLFAFTIDQVVIVLMLILIPYSSLNYLIIYLLYYIVISIITKGYTIGKKVLKMRITNFDGEICSWYQYIFRYSLQVLFIFIIPALLSFLITYFYSMNNYILLLLIMIITLIYFGYLFVKLCMKIFNNKLFMYEKMSKTVDFSVIKVDKIDIKNKEDDNIK